MELKYAVKLPTEVEKKKIIEDCKLGNSEGKVDIRFVIDRTLECVQLLNSGYFMWPHWAQFATMDKDKTWCLWKKEPTPYIPNNIWILKNAILHWDYVLVKDEKLSKALSEICPHIRWAKCIIDKSTIASKFHLMETTVR